MVEGKVADPYMVIIVNENKHTFLHVYKFIGLRTFPEAVYRQAGEDYTSA